MTHDHDDDDDDGDDGDDDDDDDDAVQRPTHMPAPRWWGPGTANFNGSLVEGKVNRKPCFLFSHSF